MSSNCSSGITDDRAINIGDLGDSDENFIVTITGSVLYLRKISTTTTAATMSSRMLPGVVTSVYHFLFSVYDCSIE